MSRAYTQLQRLKLNVRHSEPLNSNPDHVRLLCAGGAEPSPSKRPAHIDLLCAGGAEPSPSKRPAPDGAAGPGPKRMKTDPYKTEPHLGAPGGQDVERDVGREAPLRGPSQSNSAHAPGPSDRRAVRPAVHSAAERYKNGAHTAGRGAGEREAPGRGGPALRGRGRASAAPARETPVSLES